RFGLRGGHLLPSQEKHPAGAAEAPALPAGRATGAERSRDCPASSGQCSGRAAQRFTALRSNVVSTVRTVGTVLTMFARQPYIPRPAAAETLACKFSHTRLVTSARPRFHSARGENLRAPTSCAARS